MDRSEFRVSGARTKARPNGEDIAFWRDELGPEMCARFEAFDWDGWGVATDLPPDAPDRKLNHPGGKTVGLEYHMLHEGLWLHGYADRLDVDRLGNMRVVDYKTGKRLWTSAQRQIYMVLGQMLGLRTVYAAFYDARKGELHQVPCKWTPDVLIDYVRRAEQAWLVPPEQWRPNVGQACDWCPVRAYCKFAP